MYVYVCVCMYMYVYVICVCMHMYMYKMCNVYECVFSHVIVYVKAYLYAVYCNLNKTLEKSHLQVKVLCLFFSAGNMPNK